MLTSFIKQLISSAYLIALLAVSLLSPEAAQSAGGWNLGQRKLPDAPKWALEIKRGDFKHELIDFHDLYGSSEINNWAIAFAYKPLRIVEVGLEYGRINEQGAGLSPLNGVSSDNFDITFNPAHLYILVRGVWGEDQVGVPYIGGGATRVAAKQKVAGDDAYEMTATGNHYRYGLQILLDRADRSLAREGRSDHGIRHTYLFFEKQHIEAEANGIEVGGDTFFVGLLFEF